ncbi:MAG: trehalose-phosphatase [Acidobacteriota bacterium]
MRSILSRESNALLSRLAHEKTLCAFDFDGTLAPIVEHPDQAGMRDQTRRLLVRLAALYPCVILSGRTRADLLGKLRGVDVEKVIGSHGAESSGPKNKSARPQVQRWKAAIELELGPVPGLWVEDKGLSLAVHYRQAGSKAEVQRRIHKAVQNLERARVFGGKHVVNVVVDGDPDKGTALTAERDRLRCDWVLYVGDDDNDEDAFAIGGNLVGVRVGRKLKTHARYFLRSQPEINLLLERMVDLREHRAAIRPISP